jgi:nucleotide-binding universal stress UspA family protein
VPEPLAGCDDEFVKETIAVGSIVVAVDGSEDAERAVVWAAEQAALEHRPLVAVAVGDGVAPIADRAAEMARGAHPELDVGSFSRYGDARQVLIELSARAHLLVVGSRGLGTLRSMLLGSVSATVSARADCPVIVCRPPTEDRPGGGVIVGADGSPESLPVIEFAFQQASLHGLRLTVLHVYWDAVAAAAGFRKGYDGMLDDADLEDLRAVLSESVAGFAEKYPDVPVTLSLKHGLVDEALSPRGAAWDLIVVGRHPMDSVGRVLVGSIATAVIERARATVAVVPEAKPDAD